MLASIGGRVAAVVLGACAVTSSAQTCDVVDEWKQWEKVLRVTNTTNPLGSNPYRDYVIRVTFSRPGTSFTQDAFWDNDPTDARRFKIRAALASGTWTWGSIQCLRSDGAACPTAPTWSITSGCITVNIPTTPTGVRLYDKGFPMQLGLSFGGNVSWGPIVYRNAEPFFWAGDTAWMAPPREIVPAVGTAQRARWNAYLANRRNVFTVIQTAPAVAWTDVTPPPPAALGFSFERQAGCTPGSTLPDACTRPLKNYWDQFDDLIRRANEQDLVVLIEGLIHPVGVGPYPAVPHAVAFARYLAARTAGRAVLLSPGFDDKIGDATADGSTVAVAMQRAGLAIKAAAPHTIATNHLGGASPCSAYESFRSQGWMTFMGYQSGHGGHGQTSPAGTVCGSPYSSESDLTAAMRRAIEMPVGLSAPTLPVIMHAYNVEGPYDPHPAGAKAVDNRLRVRQAAYATMLSGGTGFTYGNDDVWAWNQLTTGIFNSPSKQDMQRFFQFFQPQDYRLSTFPAWIANQQTAFEKRMVLASDGTDRVAAYLPGCDVSVSPPACPGNNRIEICTSGLAGLSCGTWTGTWLRPYNGTTAAAACTSGTGHVSCPAPGAFISFNKPGCTPAAGAECDWVLDLRRN